MSPKVSLLLKYCEDLELWDMKYCRWLWTLRSFLLEWREPWKQSWEDEKKKKELTCRCKRDGFDPWIWKSAWRRKWQPTPMGRGAWQITVHWFAKSWTWLITTTNHSFILHSYQRAPMLNQNRFVMPILSNHTQHFLNNLCQFPLLPGCDESSGTSIF